MKRKKPFFLALALSALISIPCFASPMVLGINGNAEVGASAGAEFINFGGFPMGPPYVPSPSYGTFEVSLVNPGVFQSNAVVPGDFGMIQSLNSTTTPVGTVLTPNPATDKPFMKFNSGGSNLEVFLTELLQGTTVGPFTLADTPTGATASFDINGFVFNKNDSTTEQISGLFSATSAGTTVAQLLAMAAAGQTIPTPYSATFTVTAVPEPISLFLMGAGLMGAGLVARRKI